MDTKKFNAIKEVVFNSHPNMGKCKDLAPREREVACMIRDHPSLAEDLTEVQYEEVKAHFEWLSGVRFKELVQRYSNGSFPDDEYELAMCIYGLDGRHQSTAEICAQILVVCFEYYQEALKLDPLLTETDVFKYLALMAWEQGSIEDAVLILYANDGTHGANQVRDFLKTGRDFSRRVKESRKDWVYKIMADKFYEFLLEDKNGNEAKAKDKVCNYIEKNNLFKVDSKTKTGKKPSRKTVERAITANPQQ